MRKVHLLVMGKSMRRICRFFPLGLPYCLTVPASGSREEGPVKGQDGRDENAHTSCRSLGPVLKLVLQARQRPLHAKLDAGTTAGTVVDIEVTVACSYCPTR